LALMRGAGAGHAAGQDFGAFAHEGAELGSVLIVNVLDFADTKLAYLTALTGSHGFFHKFSPLL